MRNEETPRKRWLASAVAGLLLVVGFMVALSVRNGQTPREPITSPLATPTVTATFTNSPIETPTLEPTEKPLPLPTDVATVEPTNTPEPTDTPEPTTTPEIENPTVTPTPYEYIVQRGDWLSKIAFRHTGNALDWPQIVAVHDAAAELPKNQHLRRHVGHNPDLIFTGEVLRLPQDWVQEGP